MMKINFCKEAEPVSDYEIENFFQENKNKEVIDISSMLLLYRFRVAVAKKEIEPFEIRVEDFNGKMFHDVISPDGKFNGMGRYNDIWLSEILSQEENYLRALIGF